MQTQANTSKQQQKRRGKQANASENKGKRERNQKQKQGNASNNGRKNEGNTQAKTKATTSKNISTNYRDKKANKTSKGEQK